MRRIAVTGYVHISDEVAQWVLRAFTSRLGEVLGPPVHGITCLAKGVDQLFARAVLARRGTFEVVLPAKDYRQTMLDTGDGEQFCELLEAASAVETMPFETSDRAAYLAASEAMLGRCDLLLAVWDGNPSRRVGDTADVVRKAQQRDVPVEILWPSRPAGSDVDDPVPPTPAEARGRG